MALLDELTTGPLAAELAPLLADGDDTAIYNVLHRADITVNGAIAVNDFAIWAASTGLRAAIADHADNIASPLRSIALTLLDLLQGNLAPNLDFGNAANVTMLEAWVTAGALTEAQRDELLTLSQKLISRAQQAGIAATLTDIRQAIWHDDGSRRLN
jgi:hypothetical protein